tara:strand:+ start:621 stop:1694 length:1074 start_codon:yes stop_codon:yes gene_type:complete
MASAEDILNSLSEPVDSNINTDPNIGEIGFGIPGAGKGLELLYDTFTDSDFYSMLGNTAKDVGTDLFNTGVDTADFITGLPLSPMGAIPGREEFFDWLQLDRDSPLMYENQVGSPDEYEALKTLQNNRNNISGELGIMDIINDPETSDDDKIIAVQNVVENIYDEDGTPLREPIGLWEDTKREIKNHLNNTGIYESRVSDDNPYKDLSKSLRLTANAAGAAYGTASAMTPKLVKWGLGGIASAVNKLPKSMQKVAQQAIPFMSGKGSFWPKRTMVNKNNLGGGDMIQVPKGNFLKRDWNKIATQPTTIRNIGYGSGIYGAKGGYNRFSNNDEKISDSFNRDQVTYDSFINDRMNNRD